jgi:hypothetical protein
MTIQVPSPTTARTLAELVRSSPISDAPELRSGPSPVASMAAGPALAYSDFAGRSGVLCATSTVPTCSPEGSRSDDRATGMRQEESRRP